MKIIIGILIPFFGTVLGAALIFGLKNKINRKVNNLILGFAAGVMVAASIWSLIIPSLELSGIIPAVIGLSLGIVIFYILDLIIKKVDINRLMVAVTIHNIPEGMAVGILFASYLLNNNISLASCYALSVGVAIQNFPEGLIVALPMLKKGNSKLKSFWYGVISALFELLGAIVTFFFTSLVSFILPFFLSFAAGAMLYVVVVELIPESNDNDHLNVLGYLLGFIIMMVLDVLLG